MANHWIIGVLLITFIVVGCQSSRQGSELTYTPVQYGHIQGFDRDTLSEVVPALKRSCTAMLQQPNKQYPVPLASGLSGRLDDWTPFCNGVMRLLSNNPSEWRSLIETHLTPYHITLGPLEHAHITGYYEPLLHGARKPYGPYQTPLYQMPSDDTTGKVSRSAIVKGALSGKGLELVWVDDPVDAFFIQIQGSGRVQLDTGETLRLGYAGTNQHPYHAIGKTLLDRGELKHGTVSMQTIRQWLKLHPERAEEIMSTNASYVYFRILTDDGPIGSQGVSLTPECSIAIDPAYIGLGTPIWIDINHPDTHEKPIQKLVVAQDTGGAIKGGLRADFFFGFGPKAAEYAGLMNGKGTLILLLPKG
jgi:membrane-bound lytic murein transglycosylase A